MQLTIVHLINLLSTRNDIKFRIFLSRNLATEHNFNDTQINVYLKIKRKTRKNLCWFSF